MHSSRSRSPAHDPIEIYRGARAAGRLRGGPKQKRRLKSACLGLLERLLQICDQIERRSGFLPPEIERRREVAIGIHTRIKQGWLPKRWEPLLPSAEDSDLESNLAESIWLSDSEEETLDNSAVASERRDRPPTPPLPPRLVPKEPGQPPPPRPVPQEPRCPPPPSHSSTPIIRPAARPQISSAPSRPPLPRPIVPRPTSSGSGHIAEPAPLQRPQATARPESAAPVIDLESPSPDDIIDWSSLRRKGFSLFNNQGVEIEPRWKLRADRSTLVSIDFHQVLDVSRTSFKEVEKPSREGQIVPTNLRVLEELAQRFTVVVTSFVHTNWRKESVVEACRGNPHISYILICKGRAATGFSGKLSCLEEVAQDQSFIHIDDNEGVCCELRDCGNPKWSVLHVQVPRKPFPVRVHSFRNLSEILDRFKEALRINQARARGR